MKRKTNLTLPGLLAPALLVATPGLSQTAPVPPPADTLAGGALVTLDLSLGLVHEDDEGEPSRTFLGTGIDLGVFSETRNQRFSFSVGTQAELDEDMSEFTNSDAQLAYAIFNRYTEAAIDLSYRETDIGDDDEFDEDTLTVTSGTRTVHAGTLRLITGRTTRFGTETVLGYEELDYTDTSDPDLVSETTHFASTTLRFTLNRQAELRVFGDWSEEVRDETPEEVETLTRFGVGGTFLIDRAWTGTAELSWSEIETEAGGMVTTEDGVGIALGAVRTLPNGTLSFDYSREVTSGADIDTFIVTRDMSLANGAELTASIGAVAFEDSDVLPALGLSYSHEFMRGQFLTASLVQDGNVNGDDESTFRTQVALAYRQELTSTSFWAARMTAAAVDVVDGASLDGERVSLGVEYGHALTRDWNLVARADHSRVYEDGMRTDSNNRFSLNLERSFSFRP